MSIVRNTIGNGLSHISSVNPTDSCRFFQWHAENSTRFDSVNKKILPLEKLRRNKNLHRSIHMHNRKINSRLRYHSLRISVPFLATHVTEWSRGQPKTNLLFMMWLIRYVFAACKRSSVSLIMFSTTPNSLNTKTLETPSNKFPSFSKSNGTTSAPKVNNFSQSSWESGEKSSIRTATLKRWEKNRR